MNNAHIGKTLEKALADESLTGEEISLLLALDPDSDEMQELLDTADRASREWAHKRGYIWASIGLDYSPCPMNCTFCSLGEKWGIIKEPWTLKADEILDLIHRYDLPEVRWITLRTSEFYSIDKLIQIARLAMPLKHAELVVNTGEFDRKDARALYEAGFNVAYHVMRLREGVDTGVDPNERLITLEAIKQSPLQLAALVDPIGPEHTDEELVEAMFLHKAYGASLMGAMARFAVAGTPKHEIGTISQVRLAQITAVSRLVAGKQVDAICTHPADDRILTSGANTVVVEYGAIPRDTKISQGDWKGFDIQEALKLLRGAGYEI